MRVLALSLVASTLSLLPSAARADVDCPTGSRKKTEGANEWCEPSVCTTDAQCLPGELCKPVSLCVEIGHLKSTSAATPDAGDRLMARQRCGPDRACPASTNCLDGNRCITKSDAEKMGLLAAAAPSASSGTSAGASGDAGGKKCGCRVPGGASSSGGALAVSLLAAAAVVARRRRS